MRKPKISVRELETWAGYLVEHSLGGLTDTDVVMIKGERVCWPLMAVLERRVIEAGAVPDVLVVPPNNERGRVWSAAMARFGRPDQLAKAPAWHRQRYQAMTKYVEVLGSEDPNLYLGLTADQLRALAAADQQFTDIRVGKQWVLTLFPTPAFAAIEGLSFAEYTRFVVRASTTDPRPQRAALERLAPVLERGRAMTIVTEDPDQGRELELHLDISQSRPRISWGLRNFPDGEVFTSPHAGSSNGEVFIDLPVNQGAVDVEGVYLRLEQGRIVEYRARRGHEQLAAVIETDEGSHRLGEVAFGMNPGLDRVLKHPLFLEKVGGTMHIALGASYRECFVEEPESASGQARLAQLERDGVLNRSAQHVDVVIDFRQGGCGRRVSVDGVPVVVRDRIWQLEG